MPAFTARAAERLDRRHRRARALLPVLSRSDRSRPAGDVWRDGLPNRRRTVSARAACAASADRGTRESRDRQRILPAPFELEDTDQRLAEPTRSRSLSAVWVPYRRAERRLHRSGGRSL